ncbi:MAG: 4a-hydroxytetrahydrobiopterin dehydratase [Gemmatimonadetes bacterium]|nr:4a-hydroxytetrahydrobiopterin dehydratase [Gemmatimonadota bacterium]
MLSDIEIQRELNTLEGWSRRGGALVKVYEFPTFAEAIAWVNRVAAAAEAAGHHPDLDIRFRQVNVSLSTHDSGGITALDLSLARAMDLLIGPGEPDIPDRGA